MSFSLLSTLLRRATAGTKNLQQKNVLAAANLTPSRFASKLSGKSVKNKRSHTRPKNRGIKYSDGDIVQKGTILATQLQLRYYPGENVLAGRKMTLNAMKDGEVLLTRETLNPYPDSPIYHGVASGEVIERVFIHVLPHKQENKFKLVSLL